jgi:S-adenosylmethionine:diacylglycerol 3-amino-3-carboxypropyl transferase
VIFTEGFPFEAKPEIFQKMKDGIKTCKIEFHQGDLIKIIEKDLSDKIDFISFSDILSYFDDQTGSKYLQKIKDKLNINAMTVHRYYFHINKYLNYNGYKKITKNFLNQIHDEKTQIYIIDVYKRKEN